MTGVSAADDGNSYWRVRGGTAAVCQRGTPVRCGQAIRLTHLGTGRNLHSHRFTSPLSGNQVPPGDHCPRSPGSVSFPEYDLTCLVTRVLARPLSPCWVVPVSIQRAWVPLIPHVTASTTLLPSQCPGFSQTEEMSTSMYVY